MVAFATVVVGALLSWPHTTLAFSPSRLGYVNRPHSTQTTTSIYLGDFFNFGKKDEETKAAAVEEEEPEDDDIYYDDDDPIEKIFGVFFGKKERAPQVRQDYESFICSQQNTYSIDL